MAGMNAYKDYIQTHRAATQPAASQPASSPAASVVNNVTANLSHKARNTNTAPAAGSAAAANTGAQSYSDNYVGAAQPVAAQPEATQPTVSKTTYIDANGEKREGYIIDGRTYQDSAGTTPVGAGSIVNAGGTQYIKMPDGSGMLYSEYLAKQTAAQPASYGGAAATPAASYSDGGSAAPAQSSGGSAPYQTVYYDSRGNQKTGYIINGKTYTDAAGTQEVPVGSYVQDSSGRIWYKDAGNVSSLVSSPLEEDHYDYMTGANNSRELEFTNPVTGKVNYIAANPDKGYYLIYDSKHNSMGYIDSAGVYHSAYYDEDYDQKTSQAALQAAKAQGYTFDGNGIVKIAAGDDLNMDRAFLINQYSDALERGEDGADVLAKLGMQYDANGKVVSIPGATVAPGSGIKTSTGQQSGAELDVQRQQVLNEQTRQLEAIQQRQAEYQAAGNAQMQALEQQLAEVDRLLEQAKADNESAYALQLEQARANIQRQIDALNAQFRDLNRQLYVDYMMARRDLPQRLAAQGYTGGLRESSMLGLETGYGANLAENERQRLTGIRDIEAGGLENERELGIAQIQAQREAEDLAYTRAAAVRAAMIEQQNLQERYSREDEATARSEARNQIDAFLSAGGSPSAIPQDLLSLSGYDGVYLYAVADAVQRAEASAKPTLTAAQVNEAIKTGNLSPNVLSAYEYYYGAPYEQQTPYYYTPQPDTNPAGNKVTAASIANGVQNIIKNGGAYAYEDAADYAYAYVANGIIDAETAAAIVANAMKK